MNNTFNNRSRQMNEREVARQQSSFDAGMFRDIPNVPENGVADLINYLNKGDYLEGIDGSREWGDYDITQIGANLPSLATGYSLTKSGTTVTKTVGTNFASTDKGNFIVYDDGEHEEITEVLSTTQVTVASSTAHSASTAAWIRGPVHSIYYHMFKKKILLHIGTRLYVSDTFVSSWEQTFQIGTALGNVSSIIDEFNQYAFVFTSGGIYKTNLNDTIKHFYKINTPIPTVQITSSAEANSVYERRVVYTLSRLSSPGFVARGYTATVEQETGSTLVNSQNVDYGTIETEHAISVADGIIYGDLTLPSSSEHITHYTLWTTKDLGTNGTDPITGIGNNIELYVYNGDFPVATSFVVTSSSTTVTATSGTFDDIDKGSILKIGSTNYTIVSVDSPTQVTVNTAPGVSSATAANIGGGTNILAYQFAYTVTATSSVFTSADVGKPIFWSDGTIGYIKEYISGFQVKVTVSSNKGGVGAELGICMNPTSRKIYDYLSDEILQSSIVGGDVLNQRFWEPLPYSTLGLIAPGYMMTSEDGGSVVYYSQMPQGFEYITGYYYSPFQYFTIKDSIKGLAEVEDEVVVIGNNSMTGVQYSQSENKLLEELGVSYSVITSTYPINKSIGILDATGWCYIDNGIMLFTNEPGIRVYVSKELSENLVQDRLKLDLMKFTRQYSLGYSPINGAFIWGVQV